MKGIKKCFGLFLVLAIMLGLSLNASSGASALRHDYDTLKVVNEDYFYSSSGGYTLQSLYHTEYPQSNPLSRPVPKRMRNYGNELLPTNHLNYWNYTTWQNGECLYNSDSYRQSNVRSSNSTNTVNWFNNWDYMVTDYGYPPTSGTTYNCNPVPGSWYSWDSIYMYGVSKEWGVGRYSTLKDIFGGTPNEDLTDLKYMYSFGLPLVYNESTVGKLTPGREIQFSFRLQSAGTFLSSDIEGNLSQFDINHLGVSFRLQAIDEDNSQYSSNTFFSTVINNSGVTPSGATWFSDCNMTKNQIQPDQELITELIFTCKFTSPTTLSHVHPNILFYYHDPNESSTRTRLYPIWYNEGEVRFGASYIVTDNDWTPGASASIPPSGAHLEEAPGYSSTIGYDDDGESNGGDLYNQLTTMFSFNFTNPFGAYFASFRDNSSCVNIPILADMIHAEQTTYCPWFDSATRDIVTPILSTVAVMLCFGFLVRWLKSTNSDFSPESSKGGD